MRIWWYLLAIIFGFLAFMTVWLWPQKPLWSKVLPANVGLTRYQPVHDKLIAIAYSDQKEPPSNNQRVLVWNALTGEFLQEFELFFDEPLRTVIQIAPDLRTVLVTENNQLAEQGPIRSWSIYDLTTGHRRFGPQRDSFLNARPWSADGRWFYSSSIRPGNKHFLSIRSLATGEVVREFQPPEGYHSGAPEFAPDGSSTKLFWEFVGSDGIHRGDSRKLISIHELPSGKELKRIELPENRQWAMAREWNGESLVLVASRMEGKKAITECFTVYPFQPNPIESMRFDPVLSKLEDARMHEEGDYDIGASWMVEKGAVKPEKVLGNWFVRARDWIVNKMQVDITPQRYFAACYTRPEGIIRFELTGLASPPTHVVNDGHLLLTSKRETRKDPWTLEAWDLYPPPRWLWSLGTGLVTAALFLLLGRWRFKRTQRMLNNSELKA